ncbi:unnamed protein product, partial [Discosporangium mesarthrocarpum]
CWSQLSSRSLDELQDRIREQLTQQARSPRAPSAGQGGPGGNAPPQPQGIARGRRSFQKELEDIITSQWEAEQQECELNDDSTEAGGKEDFHVEEEPEDREKGGIWHWETKDSFEDEEETIEAGVQEEEEAREGVLWGTGTGPEVPGYDIRGVEDWGGSGQDDDEEFVPVHLRYSEDENEEEEEEEGEWAEGFWTQERKEGWGEGLSREEEVKNEEEEAWQGEEEGEYSDKAREVHGRDSSDDGLSHGSVAQDLIFRENTPPTPLTQEGKEPLDTEDRTEGEGEAMDWGWSSTGTVVELGGSRSESGSEQGGTPLRLRGGGGLRRTTPSHPVSSGSAPASIQRRPLPPSLPRAPAIPAIPAGRHTTPLVTSQSRRPETATPAHGREGHMACSSQVPAATVGLLRPHSHRGVETKFKRPRRASMDRPHPPQPPHTPGVDLSA